MLASRRVQKFNVSTPLGSRFRQRPGPKRKVTSPTPKSNSGCKPRRRPRSYHQASGEGLADTRNKWCRQYFSALSPERFLLPASIISALSEMSHSQFVFIQMPVSVRQWESNETESSGLHGRETEPSIPLHPSGRGTTATTVSSAGSS